MADPPLCPRERAAFATMSRLISCLVTEQITPAFYTPLNDAQAEASGVMFVLSSNTTSNDNICSAILSPDDIFAIVPLQHEPIFKDNINRGRIGLVDPLDMLPFVYRLIKMEAEAERWVCDTFFLVVLGLMISFCLDQDGRYKSILSSLSVSWELGNPAVVCRVQDPLLLWQKFSEIHPIEDKVREAIENEIRSSFYWQSWLLPIKRTHYI